MTEWDRQGSTTGTVYCVIALYMGFASMFGKVIVGVIFLGILLSLGSALFQMVRGGNAAGTFKALRIRIALSVALFFLLFVLYGLGFIQPHGGPI